MADGTPQDVLRFVTIRPPDRAASTGTGARIVAVGTNADVPVVRSVAAPAMPAPSPTQIPNVDAGVIRAYLAQYPALSELDAWLAARGDAVSADEIAKWLSESGAAYLVDANARRTLRAQLALLVLGCARQRGLEAARDTLYRLLQVVTLLDAVDAAEVATAADVATWLATVVLVFPATLLPPASGLARRPTIADLKVVRTKLIGYLPGEIAYIENVMPGETRARSVRQVRDSVDVRASETERDSESTRETATTDRFELEKEASREATQSMQAGAGVSVTASYGSAVSVTASGDFAMSQSRNEAERESSRYAREMLDRASARIRERSVERRTSTLRETLTQYDRHSFENTAQGATKLAGIYRWVDKVYEAQVYAYGRRLLLDFVVPDPAALFLTALRERRAVGVTATNPRPPTVTVGSTTRAFAATDISDTATSAHLPLAAEYQVSGLQPPPPFTAIVSTGHEDPYKGTESPSEATAGRLVQTAKTLKVPDGYRAKKIRAVVYADDWRNSVKFSAFGIDVPAAVPGTDANGGSIPALPGIFEAEVPSDALVTGDVPFALYIRNTWGYTITVHLECERLPAAYAKWQQSTYESILLAYYQLKREYEAQVAAAETRTTAGLAQQSDAANRETERNELKRGVVSLLMQHNLDGAPLSGAATTWQDVQAGPTPDRTSRVRYPALNFPVAAAERDTIQWFEQAFEWQNLMYVFYPYFWKDRPSWLSQINTDHPDPLFANFLRAGAARVQVPVRPGFEQAILFYLATGIVWNGARVPQSGDPLYVSLVTELQERLQAPDGGVPEGSSWPVRLPTTLVWLGNDTVPPAPPVTPPGP